MSEAKHTLGSWEVFGGRVMADRRALTIADASISDVLSDEQKQANTRLIAAAPDLLAVLIALEREFFPSPHPDDYSEWTDARAAIAKALGS